MITYRIDVLIDNEYYSSIEGVNPSEVWKIAQPYISTAREEGEATVEVFKIEQVPLDNFLNTLSDND